MGTAEAVEKLFEIINHFVFSEKKKPFYFEGIDLYPAETHLILEIKGVTMVNATRMAEQFGITKGAMSQTLKRLEAKGILKKSKDPYNKNELSVTLTPLGKRAYGRCKQMRDMIAARFRGVLATFEEREQEAVARFLSDLSDALRG